MASSIWELFGHLTPGKVYGAPTTIEWAAIDAYSFVLSGLAGGYLFRWSNSSFLIFFLIFGSIGAIGMQVAGITSTAKVQQNLRYSLQLMYQDLPVYLLVSAVTSVLAVIILVLGILLFEDSIEVFIEPILFFLPGINQNLIVANIIGRLVVPIFALSMLANIFVADIYAFPLDALLYVTGFIKTVPSTPQGRTEYYYANIPGDLFLMLLGMPMAVYNAIKDTAKGEWNAVYSMPVMAMANVGTGAGALILDIHSGKWSKEGGFWHTAWDDFKHIF